MSALSIRNMNWTTGQMELNTAPAPERSIEDELLGKLEFLQKAKTREMKWSQTRKDGKSACMFCKLAVSFHEQELSIRDQILLIASVQPEQTEAQPNHYDNVINGKAKMTPAYRAQLHAEYNARFTH